MTARTARGCGWGRGGRDRGRGRTTEHSRGETVWEKSTSKADEMLPADCFSGLNLGFTIREHGFNMSSILKSGHGKKKNDPLTFNSPKYKCIFLPQGQEKKSHFSRNRDWHAAARLVSS